MAFQPIVDLRQERVWGHEALVRGLDGASAAAVLAQVNDDNRYRFDQQCRVKAVELAAQLFPNDGSRLSVNFQPGAVYEPAACIQATLKACSDSGFDPARLTFEFTENEPIVDVAHVERIIDMYRQLGFTTAIDDFGAGYAGLNVLAQLRPDLVKIDMQLVRGIAESPRKQAILRALTGLAHELGITLLAEGVETEDELAIIRGFGIDLAQGYYFARPTVAELPAVSWH